MACNSARWKYSPNILISITFFLYFSNTIQRHLGQWGFRFELINVSQSWNISNGKNQDYVAEKKSTSVLGKHLPIERLQVCSSQEIRWYGMRLHHGPLTRYVRLRVAHAPGIPGTFSRHRLQRKPLVSDPGVTHVPWCMSRSLSRGGGENAPGIPRACATRNYTYLARGP